MHRVGRCARAGRHGTAFSLVSTDDEAHLLDLFLFLNRPFDITKTSEIGIVPPDVLEDEHAAVLTWLADEHIVRRIHLSNWDHRRFTSIRFKFQSGIYRSSKNAYKKYLSTRPPASADSNKRVKTMNFTGLAALHDFNEYLYGDKADEKKDAMHVSLLTKMQKYRPSGVSWHSIIYFQMGLYLFRFWFTDDFRIEYAPEFGPMWGDEEQAKSAWQTYSEFPRESPWKWDAPNWYRRICRKCTRIRSRLPNHWIAINIALLYFQSVLAKSDDNDISSAFKKVIAGKKAPNMDNLYKTKQKKGKKVRRVVGNVRDTENYIPYQSSDKHTEDGLAIHSFEQQARRAELSVTQEAQEAHYKPGQKKWDRVKKKMVSVENPRNGKIRTESGIWIPATYKTGRYSDWKSKNKIEEMVSQEMGEDCKFYCCRQFRRKEKHRLFILALFLIQTIQTIRRNIRTVDGNGTMPNWMRRNGSSPKTMRWSRANKSYANACVWNLSKAAKKPTDNSKTQIENVQRKNNRNRKHSFDSHTVLPFHPLMFEFVLFFFIEIN